MENNEFNQMNDYNQGVTKSPNNNNVILTIIIIVLLLIIAAGVTYYLLTNKKDNSGNNTNGNNPTPTTVIDNTPVPTEIINNTPIPTAKVENTPVPSTSNEEANNNETMDNQYADADLICTMNSKELLYSLSSSTYVYFNKDNYRTKSYGKSVFEYNNLTDLEYSALIETFCKMASSACSIATPEINEPDFGFKIERNGNTLTATEYAFRGKGITATEEIKENVKNELINSGFTCK